MKEFYITFGQVHVHSHNGLTLDKNCIGVIKANNYEEARKLSFEWFGDKFFTVYLELKKEDIAFFPRGFIRLN